MYKQVNIIYMLPINLNLSADFFREEIKDGYKVSSNTKKMWAVLLDLLNEFMKVCESNSLSYFASAGTILGAVRHKGFIPWDDDIDIVMPREDYERLCSIAGNYFKSPYFFQTEYSDLGSIRGHAQLRNSNTTGIRLGEIGLYGFNQGIFIDIFPMDNLPDDELECESYLKEVIIRQKKLRFIRAMHLPYKIQFKHNLFKMVFNNGVRFITDVLDIPFGLFRKSCKSSLEKAYKDFENCASKYNSINTERIIVTPLAMKRFSWNKDLFKGTPIYLPFEMLSIPMPSGYKQILDETYGNWQKFVISGSVHGELFVDAEKSYLEYI